MTTISPTVQERSADPDEDEELVIINEETPSMDDYLKAMEVCQR